MHTINRSDHSGADGERSAANWVHGNKWAKESTTDDGHRHLVTFD